MGWIVKRGIVIGQSLAFLYLYKYLRNKHGFFKFLLFTSRSVAHWTEFLPFPASLNCGRSLTLFGELGHSDRRENVVGSNMYGISKKIN